MKKSDQIRSVGGSNNETKHSFSEREKTAYLDYINSTVGQDIELTNLKIVPLTSETFFPQIAKGIILW